VVWSLANSLRLKVTFVPLVLMK